MQIHIITLFPEMFAALNYGILGRAQQKGKITLHLINLRDFSDNKHQRVDDKPYGGGPGMVLQALPLQRAIKHALQHTPFQTLISYLSPQGKQFDQSAAQQLSQRAHLIFIAGRYEGIDERVYQTHPYEEWSIGDFITSGGELPMMCMIDAISRLIPGVLGNENSIKEDSFSSEINPYLLDFPHYTRPAQVEGISVPAILQSGNHAAIAKWRHQQALGNTWLKRPDLLKKHVLNEQEEVLLAEFISHHKKEE